MSGTLGKEFLYFGGKGFSAYPHICEGTVPYALSFGNLEVTMHLGILPKRDFRNPQSRLCTHKGQILVVVFFVPCLGTPLVPVFPFYFGVSSFKRNIRKMGTHISSKGLLGDLDVLPVEDCKL